MGSKACIDFTKYFLFLFNLFFFILGATLLSLGLWILFDETTFISIIFSPPVSLSFFSYILAGGGVFTMAIGFFGCLGALKEVRCMLGMYFFLLVLLLASQIIGGILLYTQWKTVESRMQKAVKQLIAGFGDENSEMKHFEPTLEFVQKQMQCCGWDGFQDWHQKQNYACSCIRGSQTVTNNKTEQGDMYSNNSSVLDVLDVFGDNTTESGDMYNVTEQFYGDNSSETYSTTSTPVNPSSSSPPRQVCYGQPYEQGCKLSITKWLKQNLTLILGVCAAVVAVEFCQCVSLLVFTCLSLCRRPAPENRLFQPSRSQRAGPLACQCVGALPLLPLQLCRHASPASGGWGLFRSSVAWSGSGRPAEGLRLETLQNPERVTQRRALEIRLITL